MIIRARSDIAMIISCEIGRKNLKKSAAKAGLLAIPDRNRDRDARPPRKVTKAVFPELLTLMNKGLRTRN
jgi:hypothetical protein